MDQRNQSPVSNVFITKTNLSSGFHNYLEETLLFYKSDNLPFQSLPVTYTRANAKMRQRGPFTIITDYMKE